MVSLDNLKELILEYRKTKDSKIYGEILSHTDSLICYFINRFKRTLPYLNLLDMEELYHTSLIALHSFIMSFKETTPHRHIPCRLRSYMKVEFTKTYRYLSRENNFKGIGEYKQEDSVTQINTDLIDYEMILEKLSKKDREMLTNYYTKSKKVKEMGEKDGVTSCAIIKRIKTLLEKIRRNEYV